MKPFVAVTLAVLALTFQSARAEDRDAQFFREMDANGDGAINPEEYSLQKGVILYMLDVNHDLELQRKETKLSPEQFAQYAGADGIIDGGDFFNLPSARFSAFDQDGDRMISRKEFNTQMSIIRSGQQTAASPPER